jgi:hypothetical protein
VDSTGNGEIIKEPTPQNQPSQGTPSNQPSFSQQDTTRHHSFPGDTTAPETIGPGSAFHAFPTGGNPSASSAPVRRGFLGVTPIAILVGLVALHVFIVSVAGK